MNSNVDPRRSDKVIRYKIVEAGQGIGEDLMPDYMNILGICLCSYQLFY